jgi:hypothetical protein
MTSVWAVNAQETLSDSTNISIAADSASVKPMVQIENKKDDSKKEITISTFRPNPKKALALSFIPGAGQIYNRKYWKVPIVYAGFGALGYSIWYNNDKYQEYRKAYISIADTDDTTNDWINYIPSGMDPETVDKNWMTNALNNKQLQFRRYRDMSAIGIVLFYGLTILDAYVDAQLFDFDISPDLSLRIEPTLTNPSMFNSTATNFGISCQLTF